MTLHKKRLQWVALTPTVLMTLIAGAGPLDFEITRSMKEEKRRKRNGRALGPLEG